MADFTLEEGRRYRATITLGMLQSMASNEIVAQRLTDAGFTNVSVTGSGRTRTATGQWSQETVSGAVPPEISGISQLA